MKIVYAAHITKQDDGYLVTFPDFPETATDGETLQEALFNAAEALTLTLEGRADEGLPIPQPSKVRTRYKIAPAARVQSALLLRKARGTRPVAQVARALDTSWPAVAKLEDPRHWPSLRQLGQLDVFQCQNCHLGSSLGPFIPSVSNLQYHHADPSSAARGASLIGETG